MTLYPIKTNVPENGSRNTNSGMTSSMYPRQLWNWKILRRDTLAVTGPSTTLLKVLDRSFIHNGGKGVIPNNAAVSRGFEPENWPEVYWKGTYHIHGRRCDPRLSDRRKGGEFRTKLGSYRIR